MVLIGSAEIPNVNWPQNPEVQWTLGNSFSGSLARYGFRFFKTKLESVKKQFCWEAQKSSNHVFFVVAFLFVKYVVTTFLGPH